MNTRARIQAVLNFKPFDRLPVIEWAPWWDKTLDRWHAEGLPDSVKSIREVSEHFGLDVWLQDGAYMWSPSPPPAPAHGAGIIANAADYERLIVPLYTHDGVNRPHWEAIAAEQARGDVAVWITFGGYFWTPRSLLGIERHLFAFYDQPDLIRRINADQLEWQLRAIEAMASFCTPVFMTFAEDLSYNHGPMLSREMFDEFLAPYYRRIIPAIKKHGTLVFIDTDGDVTEPVRWFLELGVDGVLPLERQAGVDAASLRAEHPRLRMIGHFNKLTMHLGEDAMRAEFERLLPVAARGGFVISCDHQTPPGVSYADYQLYVRLFREYANKAGRKCLDHVRDTV
ncbi:MAG: uroporphyrinogen decarboxylase family protein [Kiritimatiellae bacterium]|nr:uroporphyrinogen decarboxylase family protein [Kiritimatiellia bacterium]